MQCPCGYQVKYKKVYDRRAVLSQLQVGDWVLVRFPQEVAGKMWKLSRLWHSHYRILTKSDPVTKVYFPQARQS